jgi:chorismate mutase
MSFPSKDRMLLEEAYQGILFEQVLPTLTLEEVKSRLELMSETELDTTDEVIEELWGGLKALGSGIGKGIGSAAKGLGNAAKNVGSAAWNKGKGAMKKMDQFGDALDNSIASGAKQFGKNVSNIYKSGEEKSKAEKRKQRTEQAIEDLIAMLGELQEANPDIAANLGQNFMKLSLAEIKNAIKRGYKSKAGTAGKMSKKGYFGGVKDSIKKGWQSGFQS